MPCDSVRTYPLDFKPQNRELLQEVVDTINLTFRSLLFIKQTGTTLEIQASDTIRSNRAIAALPQAYARAALQKATKRFGWRMADLKTGSTSQRVKITR